MNSIFETAYREIFSQNNKSAEGDLAHQPVWQPEKQVQSAAANHRQS